MSALRGPLRQLAQLPLLLPLLLLAAVLLGLAAPARADTAVALSKTFNGAVNFTGTQVTIRAYSNSWNACTIYAPTVNRSASLTLPTGATVLSAQLYWAGSGNTADNTVTFQGTSVSASRRYSSTTVGGGINFFGGAADVTDIVKAKGSGTYSFSGLTVANGSPWCGSEAVLGGFALLVVYGHPDEDERILNLYEGFRYMQNSSYTVTASNFGWPKPALSTREKARVGYISWEGDATLQSDGEALIFEGKELYDDMNPSGNQFNSRSSVNRDYYSYGIDFDVYDTEVIQCMTCKAEVTTTYRAGQDLVILNAEILVVPTLPVSDLSITMSRGGSLTVGQTVSYALSVKNNGPYTEAGPITVTDTLPAGMSYASSSGTGWTCSASGLVVTCTSKTALAPNATAQTLTINATVNGTGSQTNSATVAGTADGNAANNTATDTATTVAAPVSTAGYRFTTTACKAGDLVPSTDCKLYDTNFAGGGNTQIYITAVSSAGKAVAPSTTQATDVTMRFSLSCQDPAGSTVAASYAGVELPTCSKGGTTGDVKVNFKANTPSATLSNFSYADVGQIQLNLLVGGKTESTQPFVALPTLIAFKSITALDGTPDPDASSGDLAFARAGEDFNLLVGARLADGSWAPGFGKEKQPVSVSVAGAKAVPDQMPSDVQAEFRDLVTAAGGYALTGNYADVGALNLTPSIGAYLGVPFENNASTNETRRVGRFIPAYYTTSIKAPPFTCLAPMGCEAAPGVLDGAAYSGQPLRVQVTAYGANGIALGNYNNTTYWRKEVTLSAAAAPGKALVTPRLVGDTGSGIAAGKEASGAWAMEKDVSYSLATGYSVDATATPTAPAPIYLRAESSDTFPALSGSGTRAGTVSSLRATPDDSEEAGMMIVNGRLNVGNAQGSNIRRTPLALQAQYWSGSAWINHSWSDSEAPPVASMAPASARYSSCRRNLKRTTVEPTSNATNIDNCNVGATGVVKAGSSATITLNNRGTGTFWLAAPGAANAGSVWVQMDSPSWLPSTRGRVSFNATRTPMIYLREVY